MRSTDTDLFNGKHVWWAALLCICVLALSVVSHQPRALALLVIGDNDDIMRWLSIQNWLGGQGWFDMTQYRVEPPEGLSMHWSRYLDAAIGGLQMALTTVMPVEAAQSWTLALWPALLLAVFLGLVGWASLRIFGPVAAIFAIGFVMTWMPFRGITFSPGRIDHHNVQIILTTILALSMILPGRPVLRGAIAGLAAGFSLAIGLETLFLIAAAGAVLVWRAAFDATDAWTRLVSFCLALPTAAGVFFLGQTAPADWATPHCDALATPILAVLGVASVSCLAVYAVKNRIRHPALRLGIMAGLVMAGLAAFSGLVRPCLAGPYGMLTPETQTFITTYISEALPALVFATSRPLTFANVMLPLAMVTLVASYLWARMRFATTEDRGAAIGQLLVFAWVGLLGSFVQMRMNTIAAPALPLLAGFAGAAILSRITARRSFSGILAATLVALAVYGVQYLNGPVTRLVVQAMGIDPKTQIEAASFDRGCRSKAQMETLNALPRARILTTLNLGAPLILTTHHDALSVPYQRGAHVFWNGTFPFRSQELMQQAIRDSAPDYVLICRLASYDAEHGFAKALQDGQLPPWLEPVAVEGSDFLVLKVHPSALP